MIIAGARAHGETSLEVEEMPDALIITMDYHRARVGGGTYVKDGYGIILPKSHEEREEIVRKLAAALGVPFTGDERRRFREAKEREARRVKAAEEEQ